MKLIHPTILSLMACLGLCGFANTHVQGQQARLKKTTYLYGAHCLGDSTKHCLLWKPMNDFREKAGGPITFESVNDSTIVMIGGRGGASKSIFHLIKLNAKDQSKIPQSFINGTYKLIGVFDQEATKGYFSVAFYSNGINLFRMWEPAIGYLLSVDFFSNQPVNDFEKAGIVFPYSNKIRF